MKSLNGSELSDVVGRMLWTQSTLPNVFCYGGIDDIEAAIKNKISPPPLASIITFKEGFKISFSYLGKLKNTGIAYKNIKSIKYVGGTDVTNNQAAISNAVVTGVLLGPIAGLLSAALDSTNKNHLLFAIEANNGDTAIFGFPSYLKPQVDKFFKKAIPSVFNENLPS